MSQDKKGLNPLATGVAGAIIGAAAGAAAVVLSDEKNRGKAEKILTDLQKEGNKIFKEISKLTQTSSLLMVTLIPGVQEVF